MNLEMLKKYVHANWEEIPHCRDDKYYFVQNDAANIENVFSEVKYQLSMDIPKDLKTFYENDISIYDIKMGKAKLSTKQQRKNRNNMNGIMGYNIVSQTPVRPK